MNYLRHLSCESRVPLVPSDTHKITGLRILVLVGASGWVLNRNGGFRERIRKVTFYTNKGMTLESFLLVGIHNVRE